MTGPRPVVIGAPSNPSDSPTRIHSSHSATERNSGDRADVLCAPFQFAHDNSKSRQSHIADDRRWYIASKRILRNRQSYAIAMFGSRPSGQQDIEDEHAADAAVIERRHLRG